MIGIVQTMTTAKMSLLLALGTGTVLASDIAEPSIERYISLGVGGALALTMFYFYKQLAEQTVAREKEHAELLARREREYSIAYREQAGSLILTIQEATKSNNSIVLVLSELRTQLAELARDHRDRYEEELRDGGRRRYDPPNLPKDKV